MKRNKYQTFQCSFLWAILDTCADPEMVSIRYFKTWCSSQIPYMKSVELLQICLLSLNSQACA